MNIAVDAMGGDNAPLEIVKGALMYAEENGDTDVTLIGDENKISACASELGKELPENIKIVHTDVFVTMEDDPMIVMKEKNQSSMALGLKMLKDSEVDAFVSAGSTGALHAASTLIVRKIKGVRRSAIATVIPFANPVLMLDSGANPTVTSEILVQWALLGSAYAQKILGIENPRVGLLNNGTEEHKGTEVVSGAYALLKDRKDLNFVGNIESKSLPFSTCDVLITDGFTGNITLKLIEGMGKFMFSKLKDIFTANLASKLSYLAVKKQLKGLKNSFDASEYGGAPLLGLLKPVIKAHGSSKAKDIKNAIRGAKAYADSKIGEEIATAISRE